MDKRLEQFRTDAAKLGAPRRGRKFSRELIAMGAEHVRARRGEGATWQTIAQELDVTVPTAQRWAEQQVLEVPSFRRVAVVENISSERYSAVLPGGLRIEGLSLDAIISLARSLS